jgi:hypothetical protein
MSKKFLEKNYSIKKCERLKKVIQKENENEI